MVHFLALCNVYYVLDNLCCGQQRTDIVVFFILLFVFGADGLSGDSPGPFLFKTKNSRIWQQAMPLRQRRTWHARPSR